MLKFIPSKDDIITKLRIENDDCKALNFELKNKLTKYKRALDIFKRLLDDDFTYGFFADGMLLIDGSIDINDDEKELLEELMNCETSF